MKRKLRTVLLLALVCHVLTAMGDGSADPTVLPQLSTSQQRVYYVIQNAANGQYLMCAPPTKVAIRYNHRAHLYDLSDTGSGDGVWSDKYLWYFVKPQGTAVSPKSGMAVWISNKSLSSSPYPNDIYLTQQKENTYYYGNYSSTGATFYIDRHPTNILGVAISETDGINKKSDKLWSNANTNNKYTEYVWPAAVYYSGHKEDKCTSWILRSYADLVEEAKLYGYTYTLKDNPTAADFKTIINNIETKKAANKNKAFAISDGVYLIHNRAYDSYLSYISGVGYVGSKVITDNSLWQVSKTGDGVYSFVCSVPGTEGVDLSINGKKTIAANTVTDGALSYNDTERGYFRMDNGSYTLRVHADGSTNQTAEREKGYNADWELIPYDEAMQTSVESEETEMVATEEDITAGTTRFFRLSNHKDGRETFVEDIDHEIHDYLNNDKIVGSGYGAWTAYAAYKSTATNLIDIYTQQRDKSHISNLWEFELAIKKTEGSGSDDQATGVIGGSHSHNIYRIRNVNSGKYIKEPASYPSYLLLTTKKSEAAGFWLEYMADGQYRIVVRDRENSLSSDVAKGYLNLKAVSGAENAVGCQADQPEADGDCAWYLHTAPYVEVEMNNNNETEGQSIDFAWATTYLPFDVQADDAATNGVKLYAGKWTDASVHMEEIGDLPARHGALITAPKAAADDEGNHPEGQAYNHGALSRVRLNIAEAFTDERVFEENNAFHGVTESEGTGFDRYAKAYYVVAAVKVTGEGEVNKTRLGVSHPWGPYLYANKAYLNTSEVPAAKAAARYALTFDVDPGAATGIEAVDNSTIYNLQLTNDGAIYDLQGRKVINSGEWRVESGELAGASESNHNSTLSTLHSQLKPGIYIVGGKKLIVK